jgi:hypothetical protein
VPFFDDAGPQPSRAPRLDISIASAADAGGFGGLADVAASVLGGAGAPAWAEHLISLQLQRGFAPAVDVAELLIAGGPGAPGAALDDSATIAAAGDASGQLFSGFVAAVERRSDGLRRYRLVNGSQLMAQQRMNNSLTSMSVADIVGFVCDELGIDFEADVSGQDGSLAQVVLDDSASTWDHLAQLAALRGCSLWFDAAGTLRLADRLEQGDTVATFSWGLDLLEAHLWERSPHSGGVTVFGGGRANDGFVLRKQAAPNRAQQGTGTPQRFYRDGVLSSQQDLSARASAAVLAGQRQTSAGEIVVIGTALEPGSVLELAALPHGGDGLYLVREVQHSFDAQHGWRTRLQVSAAGVAGAGLAGLAAGLGGLL